jgi:hypothetical protein
MKGKCCSWVRSVMAFFMFCCLVGGGSSASAQNADVNNSYQDFYTNLAPYGQWIQDAKWGFVWCPDVDGGFRPYFTNGYWAYTQYGSTWISEYVWGWAPFHYGRWTFDSYYGWVWIPGAEWAPAWVIWRTGAGYYGWAPLSPDFNFKTVKKEPVTYDCPQDWWIFMTPKYLFDGSYYRYWAGPIGNTGHLKNTTLLTNIVENENVTYYVGPYKFQIEKQNKQPLVSFNLITSNNLTMKSHHNEIRLFRPEEMKPVPMEENSAEVQNYIKAPRPLTKTPMAVNSMQGKMVSDFRATLPKRSIPSARPGPPLETSKHAEPKKQQPVAKTAPEREDNNTYIWQNAEQAVQSNSIEYRVAPKAHPDRGPIPQADPLPKPKHPPLKKLPGQSTQPSEQIGTSETAKDRE